MIGEYETKQEHTWETYTLPIVFVFVFVVVFSNGNQIAKEPNI